MDGNGPEGRAGESIGPAASDCSGASGQVVQGKGGEWIGMERQHRNVQHRIVTTGAERNRQQRRAPHGNREQSSVMERPEKERQALQSRGRARIAEDRIGAAAAGLDGEDGRGKQWIAAAAMDCGGPSGKGLRGTGADWKGFERQQWNGE